MAKDQSSEESGGDWGKLFNLTAEISRNFSGLILPLSGW